MSDLNTALLSFLKLSNVIDPRITSFRDFDNPSIFHDIFFSLFKVKCPADDQQFKTRMMFRWLFEHVPKQLSEDFTIKPIQVEDFENCEVETFEQTALLIFACKTRDDTEFKNMMEKLDSSDQKVLQSLIDSSSLSSSQKNLDHQLLSHMAKEIRELSNCYVSLKKAEEEYSVASNEFKVMKTLKQVRLKEEEQVLRKKADDIKTQIISSQELLTNLEADLSEKRNVSSESELQLITDSFLDDSEETIFNLNQTNNKLKEKIKIARQNTAGIEKLREEVLQHRQAADTLRNRYQNIKKSVEEVEIRVSNVKEQFQQKNSSLYEEIRNLQAKKDILTKKLNENITFLNEAKSHGSTYDKSILLKQIREQRNQILEELDQISKKAKQLQDCHSS